MFRSCTTIQSSHGKKCPSLRISIVVATILLSFGLSKDCSTRCDPTLCSVWDSIHCGNCHKRFVRTLTVHVVIASPLPRVNDILQNDVRHRFVGSYFALCFVLWGSDLLVSCNLLVVHFVSLLVDFVLFCFVLAVAPVVFVICVRLPDPRSSRFLPSPFDKDSFS